MSGQMLEMPCCFVGVCWFVGVNEGGGGVMVMFFLSRVIPLRLF